MRTNHLFEEKLDIYRISTWFLMTPSITTKFQYANSPFLFFSHSLHVSALTGHPQVRYTVRCFQGLFLLQRIRCTYTIWRIDVICLYRYFDPCSPIHVIKLSIKVVKTWKFTAKTGLIYKKCKNVKISRWMGVYILLWWSGRSFNIFGLLVDQRRVDRAVGSGSFFLHLLLLLFSKYLFCLRIFSHQKT
jgi:hypothetical protein